MGNRKSREGSAAEFADVMSDFSFAGDAGGLDSEELTEILEGIERGDRAAREAEVARARPLPTSWTPDFNKD